MNNNDYLSHYGILGMKWGKRKGHITKPKKGKLRLNSKKIINGKNLGDEILSSFGGVIVSNLVGGFLVSRGSEVAGKIISQYGSLYSIGSGVGSVISRMERMPVK